MTDCRSLLRELAFLQTLERDMRPNASSRDRRPPPSPRPARRLLLQDVSRVLGLLHQVGARGPAVREHSSRGRLCVWVSTGSSHTLLTPSAPSPRRPVPSPSFLCRGEPTVCDRQGRPEAWQDHQTAEGLGGGGHKPVTACHLPRAPWGFALPLKQASGAPGTLTDLQG